MPAGIDLLDLTGKAIFIAASTNGSICFPMESAELKSLLENAKVDVERHFENRGHQLSIDEV